MKFCSDFSVGSEVIWGEHTCTCTHNMKSIQKWNVTLSFHVYVCACKSWMAEPEFWR